MKLTAREHGQIVERIFLDGVDVTDRCSEVDTENNYVMLSSVEPYKISDRVYGHVEVIFASPFKEIIEAGGQIE